jgi:hypothetical protein
MNIIHFGEGTCEKVRRYMDSYLSNELLVETNHDVLRHLEQCPACAEELRTRGRIKAQLQEAVRRETASPELLARVRREVRAQTTPGPFLSPWMRYAAMAACLLIAVTAAWLGMRREGLSPDWPRARQDSFISRISAPLAEVFRGGLGDHVHCAVFRRFPTNPPRLEDMAKSLGPEYSGLLQVAREAVPDNYRVVLGHKCGYNGRKFVHLSLSNSSRLISLVLARKNPGESFSTQGLTTALKQSGIPIYRVHAQQFEIATFETRDYLVYVVSDLDRDHNLHVAANLAPGVRDVLARLET